jgi:DnaJ-class molecular chaperone
MADFCPSCGNTCRSGQNFCANCGCKLKGSKQAVVVTCARCKGTGKARSYSPAGWFSPDDPNICPACGGSGVQRIQ